MRNFSIDLIWAKIQIAITAIGGWLGYFLGGIDGLMIALMIFMGLDYVTGVMCAIIDKKLSSAVGSLPSVASAAKSPPTRSCISPRRTDGRDGGMEERRGHS